MANVFEEALDVGEPNRLLDFDAIAELGNILLTTAGHRIRIRANEVATSLTGLRGDLATAMVRLRQGCQWQQKDRVLECC